MPESDEEDLLDSSGLTSSVLWESRHGVGERMEG